MLDINSLLPNKFLKCLEIRALKQFDNDSALTISDRLGFKDFTNKSSISSRPGKI